MPTFVVPDHSGRCGYENFYTNQLAAFALAFYISGACGKARCGASLQAIDGAGRNLEGTLFGWPRTQRELAAYGRWHGIGGNLDFIEGA